MQNDSHTFPRIKINSIRTYRNKYFQSIFATSKIYSGLSRWTTFYIILRYQVDNLSRWLKMCFSVKLSSCPENEVKYSLISKPRYSERRPLITSIGWSQGSATLCAIYFPSVNMSVTENECMLTWARNNTLFNIYSIAFSIVMCFGTIISGKEYRYTRRLEFWMLWTDFWIIKIEK